MAFERNTYLYPATLLHYQPRDIGLGEHIGRAMVFAIHNPRRMVTLQSLYNNLLPAEKAKADFARSWNMMEGGAQ